MLSIFNVAPEIVRKSISICEGDIILLCSPDFCVCSVRGSTQILILHDVKRTYSSTIKFCWAVKVIILCVLV